MADPLRDPPPFGGPRRRTMTRSVALAVVMAVLVLQSASVVTTERPGSSGSQDAIPGVTPVPGVAPAVPSPPASPLIGIIFPHPAWINVTNTTAGDSPPAAYGSVSAYDPVDHETVEFGGCLTVGGCPDNQTWVFANGTWTNVTEYQDAPPKTLYSSMDFDPNMDAVLLFGGCLDRSCSLVSNATWTYRGGIWTNVSYFGPGPAGRGGANMAFDPEPEENGSVLFGGCFSGFLGLFYCYNDTWAWEGYGGWVNLTPSVAPAARGFAQMAYDGYDGAVVLFGGLEGFSVYSDTWELYSGQWWNVTPKQAPVGRALGSMVELPNDSGVMMFGGFNASGDDMDDTWVYVDNTWVHQAPTATPPPRDAFGLALDGTGQTVILEGGTNNSVTYGDTWAYEFPPYITLNTTVSSSEVLQTTTFSATASDGTGPFRVSFEFGDGAFAYASGAGRTFSVTHAYETAGVYNVSVFATDAVGATTSELDVPFTVTPGPSVSARAVPGASDVGQAVSFVSTVLVNGTLPLNYTWEFGDHSPSAYGASTSHTFRAAGDYTVTLKAKDSDGDTDNSSFSIAIAEDPTLTIAATSTSPSVGSAPTFFANVTGGTGPYSYAWQFGDGGRSALPTPQHVYARPGTYTVRVWVNDSVGAATSANLTVTVPGSSAVAWGSIGAAPLWFWGGIGALAAVGAGGSFWLLRRARLPKP